MIAIKIIVKMRPPPAPAITAIMLELSPACDESLLALALAVVDAETEVGDVNIPVVVLLVDVDVDSTTVRFAPTGHA